MNIEAPRWNAFADRFTRDHDGWSATLELREPDGTIETAVDDRPFRGISFENRGGHESVVLVFGDEADEHLAHIVANPKELVSVETELGREASLIIGVADGSGCILELANPWAEDS